jgi:membrane-bound lytic murein transglycosylase B
VTVPESVSCSKADQGKTIAGGDGIKRGADPADEPKAEGFLLMPAGWSGPAFITPNFCAERIQH